MIRERLGQQQQCDEIQWERTKDDHFTASLRIGKKWCPTLLNGISLARSLLKPFSIKFYCKSILITFNWFLHFDMNVWPTEESKREKSI